MRPAREVDLVVLVSGFPSLSQTFVLHELLHLEGQGLRLHLVALRRSPQVVRHDALDRLQATVEYLEVPVSGAERRAVRAAHASLFARNPVRYLGALARIVRSPDYASSEPAVRLRLARPALLARRIVSLGSPPLYIHFVHRPATFGRYAALLAGVPYAVFGHARDIWETPRDDLAVKVRDASLVLTCTDEARRYLGELALGATPIRLAYHGVEIPPAPATAQANEVPVVLSIGRLVEKKGYPTLLRAAALLRERGLAFTVRLGGDGPEWPKLQRLVHHLSIADRVVFLGPLTDSEVQDEYARADVFALPCQLLEGGDRDGVPNSLLEAMGHGLPIVSTRLAGVSEAVTDGDSGLLVPPEDPAGLADAIERLLGYPDLRAALGSAARRRVRERFDRGALLPEVHAALAEAGLVRRRVGKLRAEPVAAALEG